MFLLLIGVFSYYFVVSGYRILHLKKLHIGQKPQWFDWLIAAVAIAFNSYCVCWSLMVITKGGAGMAYVALGFGGFGLLAVLNNTIVFFRPPTNKMHWWFSHMGNMLGGFIAAVTAVSATVLSFAGVWAWIWPIACGVPAIIIWSMYNRKKFSSQ